METYEVLEKALALIEDERNWWQAGNPATNSAGKCAVLAVGAALLPGEAIKYPLDSLLSTLGGENHSCIAAFNDSHSHAEVVALFQEAIREEKRKAGVPLDVPEPQREEVAA